MRLNIFFSEADISNQATTLAYILKYNLQELQATNQLNTVFSKIMSYMTGYNSLEVFNDRLSKFLNADEEYRDIERNTAPFYIIMIEDACYGVVLDFALSLSKELQRFGQSVVTNKDKYGITVPLEKIGIINWKAVIGFQAPFLENPILQKLNSPKIQYWFDNPAFFYKTLFNYSGDDYYVLCHDKFYIDYLKKYYHIKNAMLCPPAGKGELYLEAENKIYDIVFVGSFKLNRMPTVTDDFIKQFYSYMIDNPTLTYEEGLNHILQDNPILQDEEQFKELHSSLASLCHIISGHYRTKVIETLINANIQIHVFGESWKLYDGEFKDNLIIHPDVSVEESLKVMSQAKISLNVMHWHKAGMTERIANSMLTGAVCVSDETTYLKENFTEDEIVLYELNHLDELPAKINKILSDDDYRRKLVHNAYSKAIKEHTWRQRAEKILELTR